MTLFWLPASTPEFAIPLLSPFSSEFPVFSIKWSSSFQVPASTPRGLVPSCSCPREAAASAARTRCRCLTALPAGSFSCPLKMRSGLKCQLDNVDIWQTELSAGLQAVWAVSQWICQEASSLPMGFKIQLSLRATVSGIWVSGKVGRALISL